MSAPKKYLTSKSLKLSHRAFYKIIGAMLRTIRIAQKLGLNEVARDLSLEASNLSRYECGSSFPPLHILACLLQYYDQALILSPKGGAINTRESLVLDLSQVDRKPEHTPDLSELAALDTAQA